MISAPKKNEETIKIIQKIKRFNFKELLVKIFLIYIYELI